MQLSKLQEYFKNTILNPEHIDAEDSAFRNIINDDHGISVQNRMKVYRNNVIRSLTNAAIAALPMTKKLIGAELLEQAMKSYVTCNLPTEGNLNIYGKSFPTFIKTYEPVRSLPYLYDFTRLEWMWELAYYAKDDLPLSPDSLMDLSEEELTNLCFQFRDSCSLIDSDHPLDEIVDFCRNDNSGDELHTLSQRGCHLMVYRPELTVEIRSLGQTEYKLLKALKEGQTIYEAAVTISEEDPNFNLQATLQKHLQRGTFKGFTIKDEK